MKILFPFVGNSVGGSHKSSIILIQSLISNGVNVQIVLHIDNGPLSDYLKLNKLKYDVLPTKYLAGTSPSLLKIAYGIFVNYYKIFFYIRKNNITIVHANDLRINLTWSFPTKFTLSKFVWHQRTLLSKSFFWNLIPYFSNFLIAISETVYSGVPSIIPIHKKKLIYNPINVDQSQNKEKTHNNSIREKYEIGDNCLLLGYVGRLNEEWKRVDFLISCFSSILYDDCHLLIVGECNSEYCSYLKKIVSDLKIESRVTFVGYISDPMFLISSLDILIAPSRNEPFGRTLLESMSQKTIVLASNSGGHCDIIKDNNGFLFELDDCNDLYRQIQYIRNNKALVDSMIENSYQYVKQNFSTISHMNQVLNVYKSL